MATRRRIGVRLATTEAARRQLMQPVVCWEKVWITPENAPPNSVLKIYKWVKTDKKQQFSDDEEEADEPLAPLPDEPEVVEGDEDMDQDEPAASVVPDTELPTHDITETNSLNQEIPSEPQTKPPSPSPPALSLQQPESMLAVDEGTDMLDTPFKGLDTDMSVNVDSHENTDPGSVQGLDMSILGPDGASFEGVRNLSQMDAEDALLGGPLMDNSGDPFAPSMEPQPSSQEASGPAEVL